MASPSEESSNDVINHAHMQVHMSAHACMCKLVGEYQVIKNWIIFELIEKIGFCLKIYDLCTTSPV